MTLFSKKTDLQPQDWGLETDPSGALLIGGASSLHLAAQFGTPLHVVDEANLGRTADTCVAAFTTVYPGPVSVHYAFKCNAVPGIIEVVKKRGLRAEVMSEFELALALRLGYRGHDIVVNGPFKPEPLLQACLDHEVRLVIADSAAELETLNRLAGRQSKEIGVLLRINPDYIPRGMNSGTATGSRKGCSFGFDLSGGEAAGMLDRISGLKNLRFEGFHFHIGSGVRDPDDYYRALCRLKPLVERARRKGLAIRVLDIGGGFAAPLSREMTNWELLRYTVTNRLPALSGMAPRPAFTAFAEAVTRGVAELFRSEIWPELLVEPGRSIASPHQVLLLQVHQVKERAGAGKWITTDGGIGTVTMPTYYEYHEVFLCNEVGQPRTEYVSINGPGCFAADQVYRNKRMPPVKPGDILAIMDSGAYFTSWESNFGFPRPAVVAVANGAARLLRRRETFEEMMQRDRIGLPDHIQVQP